LLLLSPLVDCCCLCHRQSNVAVAACFQCRWLIVTAGRLLVLDIFIMLSWSLCCILLPEQRCTVALRTPTPQDAAIVTCGSAAEGIFLCKRMQKRSKEF